MQAGRFVKGRGTAESVAGFTVVELLVVAAIIGVLAAIMFPVVIKAKEGAKVSQCLVNMKQLGNGLSLYLDDYSGRFPAAAPWGSPDYWAAPENGCQKTIQTVLRPYVRNGMIQSADGTYPTASVFCCPSDTGITCTDDVLFKQITSKEGNGSLVNGVPVGKTVWKYAGCSYEYYAGNQIDWLSNDQEVRMWTALSPEVRSSDGVQRVGAPLSSVVRVTKKAVLGDMWFWHMGDRVPDGRLAYRNTLFADGHAERVNGTDHDLSRVQALRRWHAFSEVPED